MTSKQPHFTAEWEDRIDRKLRSRYNSSLMNNTKWREVWQIVCDLQLRIQMDYADDDDWCGAESLHGPFPDCLIQERGIGDPGIGGPFLYKQILWIRIPKIWGNNIVAFVDAANKLGFIPLQESDSHLEIRGYQ